MPRGRVPSALQETPTRRGAAAPMLATLHAAGVPDGLSEGEGEEDAGRRRGDTTFVTRDPAMLEILSGVERLRGSIDNCADLYDVSPRGCLNSFEIE